MALKEARFTRKGHHIINLESGEAKEHNSVNEAKKASRKLQMDEDHGLGRGTLRITNVEQERASIKLSEEVKRKMRTGR